MTELLIPEWAKVIRRNDTVALAEGGSGDGRRTAIMYVTADDRQRLVFIPGGTVGDEICQASRAAIYDGAFRADVEALFGPVVA